MRRFFAVPLDPRLMVASVLAALLAGCGGDDGQGPPDDPGEPPVAGCREGTLESGALYQLCFPASWNGTLVIYAHGYVRPDEPLKNPDDVVGGLPVSAVVTGLGYGYATTSYRSNGLVAADAAEDLSLLEAEVREAIRPDPDQVYIVGVSEGGLVAALALERYPGPFSGALAACGPVGSFAGQIDYLGDFRVLFDYFFPGVLPGSVIEIPAELRDDWETVYAPAVIAAVQSDPSAAQQLLETAGVAVEPSDEADPGAVAVDILWYNVFGTADAQARLGGQPYDNSERLYAGSADDAALNAAVGRFSADVAARAALAAYETSGDLPAPVVTLHTTRDPIVPVIQESLYGARVAGAGRSDRLEQRTVDRFGHCAFTQSELLGAFTALLQSAAARVAAGPS